MSTRVLGVAIAALLVGAITAVIVKGPAEDQVTAEPTPTETFTFPGPVPTVSESPVIPTDLPTGTEPAATEPAGTEPAATEPGATETELEEPPTLPRTGEGSVAGPALLTLVLALGGGAAVRRAARSDR